MNMDKIMDWENVCKILIYPTQVLCNHFHGFYFHEPVYIQESVKTYVWTRAYLIPERNRTVRKQEEGKNSVYKFVFCMNLGKINALLTISCCQMKHFSYVIVY
jgi:hypothetical protein